MNSNKSIFLSQHFLAMKIVDVFNDQVKSALMETKVNKTLFPTPASLYEKDIVKERMKQLESEKEENSNFETIKFNSFNAMYDSKSVYSTKSFLNALSQNQQLQSKNAKNHFSTTNYLNQISPLINPISMQANSIFANNSVNRSRSSINNNNDFVNNSNKSYNLFKSGLLPGASSSFNLANNPISSFTAFFSNGSNNSFNPENSFNCNNNNNNYNCKLSQNNFLKRNDKSFGKVKTMNNLHKENSQLMNVRTNNNYNYNNLNNSNNNNNNINNNNSSNLNFFSDKNGGYFNSHLSENIFSLNSFTNKQQKNSSWNLLEKSELAANESTYFENNPADISFISNFNSMDSITRKSSYNYDHNNNNLNNQNKNNNENFELKKNSSNSIYSLRKNSRFFDFEKDNITKSDSLNTTSDSVQVPEFISELLAKKFSKFSFFKKFSKDDEEIQYDNFLLKEIDESHEWAKFICSFGYYEEYSMLQKFKSA